MKATPYGFIILCGVIKVPLVVPFILNVEIKKCIENQACVVAWWTRPKNQKRVSFSDRETMLVDVAAVVFGVRRIYTVRADFGREK